MLPTQLLVVLSAASADSFAAPGFCSVRLGTPPCDLLPAGHPPLQQVTLSDIPLLLARRLGAAVAGYTLTAKRERSLLASALLPPLPRHGLCATPIALPARGDPPHVLEQSLRRCDVIMHKATDQLAAPEVMPIAGRLAIARACHIYPPSHPNTLTPHSLPCLPGCAAEVEALLACAAREGMPVLDPPRLLATVFDRVAIAAVLACMPPLLGGVPTRGPTTAEVQALDPGHVAAALAGAGITLPCLLKPRVACGTPKSHHFALLTSTSGAPAACVDVPAVAQAFVRHDGTAHKVYCFADQVLTQQRRSLPAVDAASPGVAGVVSFDALHALPTSWGPPSDNASDSGGAATAADAPSAPLLSMEAVHAMAAWLRRETGLSLFGFDVLVEAHTGAHLVVDLNYFPSATGVDGAPQALASAVSAAAQRLP